MFPAFRRATVGAALLLSLLAPAALADVAHVNVDATGPGGRSLIAPGDDITLRETVVNTGSAPISNLQGSLTSSTTDVTTDTTLLPFTSTTSPGSAFIAPGDSAFDATPFQAHVPATLSCGTPLSFRVTFANGQGRADFPVQTGMAGTPATFSAPAGSIPIPDDGSTQISDINVTNDAMIKDLRVRIDTLAHEDIGDLKIELVGPDLAHVTLMDVGQGSGPDLSDTVFAASAPRPIGEAPHTGTWLAPGLSHFVGKQQAGLWRLEVTDLRGGHAAGILDGWSLESSPPVCDARADANFTVSPAQVSTNAPATFDASSSQDPQGTLRTYHWDFGDGTAAVDRDATVPQVQHTFTTRGTRTVTLTMQDANGVTLATKTMTVKVDQPPVAALSAPSTLPTIGTTVTLDASATTHDPAGSIARYEWDLNGDGVYETDGGTTPTLGFRFPDAGVTTSGPHVVRVRVTDDVGIASTASKTINVQNAAPAAAFTAPGGYLATGRATTLDATASSDSDGSVVGYQWDFDGDGTPDTPVLTTPTTQWTPPHSGLFQVTLVAIDDKGAMSTPVEHDVQVTDPPSVVVTPASPVVGKNVPVTLDTAGSADPDGTITKWEWDLDGNGTYEVVGNATRQTVSFPALGTKVLHVRATDDHQVTTEVAIPFTVANHAPGAALTASAASVPTGTAVTFDASASRDSDGTIDQYAFDLDDDGVYETVGSTPIATMSYLNPGHVDVHVRVRDNDGDFGYATVGVTITAPTGGGSGGSGGGGGTPTGTPPSPVDPGTIAPIGTGATPPAGTGGTTGSGPATGATLSATLAGASVQKLKTVLRSGVALTCRVDRAATCTVKLTMRAADARKLRISSVRGTAPVVIGSASGRSAGAGTVKLTVRLKAAAVKRLRSARKVVVLASGKAAAGTAAANLGRSLLLRG